MWNKLSQAAGLAPVESEDEKAAEKGPDFEDSKERLQQQEILVQQLKDLVRENEKRFQDKSKEYDELSSKFQKFKLQSKAKISHLSSQIKEQDKPKKEDCDFDDTSSSDSSDQSRRGKMLLLKRQLEQAKQQLEKKEQESKTIVTSYEKRITDLELQLNEKNNLISSFVGEESKAKEAEAVDKSPKKETNIQEMYAQVVYKDSKIMELNNQILEHEKKIMDLQEHIREKDEVLQQRSRAVQLMAEDMSRKGKSVVDELDETREQMKIMQENFSSTESDWKKELEKYKQRISDLENEITDYDKKLKNSEATIKSIENAKYELSVKNADLQKKIVCVQESAAKQCELYNKEIEGEVEALKKSLEAEKQHATELQKALDDSSSQSDNKVLKARVKERTKYKALERELNELKKTTQQKPEEIVELQQRVAELEEEKGSLQLKLMDFEEQVIQIDKLKEENETLKDTVQEKLNEVQSLGKRINEIQSERDKLEAKLKSLQDSYKDLEEKFHVISEEKSKLEESLSSLSSAKEEIENNYTQLKEEYSNMQVTYNDVAENLQQLKDQKVTFELKNIELEEIRESDEKAKKELLAEIEQLKESFYSESKPDIQLEKENSALKEELRIQAEKLKKSENRISELLSGIDKLQEELTSQKHKHSSEIEQLDNKIETLDVDYKKAVQDLQSKTKECVEKEKVIGELESHHSSFQNQLSDFYSCIGAKDLNDCKNYAIQKAEEYANLKNDYDKEIKEKANMLISVQEKDEELHRFNLKIEKLQSILENRDAELKSLEIEKVNMLTSVQEKDEELHRCNLKIEKLQSILENRDAELKSLETVVEKLKETVSEKENIISKISSDLEGKISSEKMLMETVQEKTQLLSNAEQLQSNLELELQTLKETQLVYQEKMKANSSSLLGQITDLETELDALRDELASKTKAIDDLNEAVLNLKKENENIHSKLKETEELIQEKNGAIENFESVTRCNKDEINALKQERECIKADILAKDSQVMELNQKLQQLENESKSHEAELSLLRDELKSKTKSIDDLNELLLSLRNENEKIHSELMEKENLIQEKDNAIADYESVDKANKDKINSLKQEVECIKAEILTKDSQIMEQNRTFQQLEKELKAKEGEISRVHEELQEVIRIRSANEETIQLLKEKNAVLENEKLHSNMSFTEKDEAYKQVLTEKMHLESEFLKLQEENRSLDALLKERVNESTIVNDVIHKLTNLITSSDIKAAEDYLTQLSDGNSNLKQLAEKYFSCLKNLQTDVDTLISENSALQSKIEEMRISVNDKQVRIQESNSIIDALHKESEESSNKYKELEQELSVLTDSKSTLEKQIPEFQMKVDNLTKENDSLRNSLDSSQEEHLLQISALNEEISNCQFELRVANEKIKDYEDDNSKLAQLSDSLEASVKYYKIKEENYEKQIRELSEANDMLEKKIEQSEAEMRDCKEERIRTEMDAIYQNARYADEMANFDASCQMLTSLRENAESTVAELRSKVTEYENEKSSFEQSTSELKERVSEKENQIIELQDQLKAQAEKLSDLQSLFDQKLAESEKYKHLIDTQFPCLQNCRQHYYLMVRALLSSFQIDADISFLEKEEWESVDEFSVKSKNVVDRVVEHSAEVQSLKLVFSSLESKVKYLEEENKSLLSQCHILRNFLTGLSNFVQNSLKENDMKFNLLLSSLQNKEATLESLKSKILILSREPNLKKSHFLELEAEKNSYLEKLEENKKSLAETEHIINTLKEENEEMKKQNFQLANQYEMKIPHLEDITRKYNDVCESNALQKSELQSAHARIQEFHTLMRSKDEEMIQLAQELEASKGELNSLQSELSSAHSTISSLQSEIKQLNKQVNDYEEESRILESSNNVSNGLQMEVENLKRELSSCEEQKNYLQQHIDNANSQLQAVMAEKANLESTVEQMQYRLDNLTEINLNLSNSLEESKLLIEQNEEKIKNMEEQHSNYMSMHEKVCQELNSLKSTKSESQSKDRMELLNKISLLEKTSDNLKNTLININSFVSNVEMPDSDFPCIDLEDETLKKIVSELQESLLQNRKHFNDKITNFQSKFEETESKNKQLCDELEKVKKELMTRQEVQHVEVDAVKTREEVITPISHEVKVDANIFQQSSSKVIPPSEPVATSEPSDPSQKREVDEYKIKFARVLSKLKLFKDKNEKLSNELQELKNQISDLEEAKLKSSRREQELVTDMNKVANENEELRDALRSIDEKHRSELNKANDRIVQLKERNSILDEECCRIRKELQEYKHTWEQSNVSYELQKEDNERLREKLKEMTEQSGELKTKISELNNQLLQLKNGNIHLQQEAENLREHANMLLSDNDTYQDLIEKLTSSKASLEQKLSNLTEKFNAELKSMQRQHELELQNLKTEPKEIGDMGESKELEKELISLKEMCSEMQQHIEKLEKERDISLRNQNLLEKEKVYLQHQLLEKVDELQKTKNCLDDIIKNKTSAPESISNIESPTLSSNGTLVHEIGELKEENGNLKSQLSSVMQELNLTKENFEIMKQDFYNKENYYVDRIKLFETPQQGNREVAVSIPHDQNNVSDAVRLENELQQAMSSLHKQGLRCEELSLEVSKLLEERNILRWKLQQYGQANVEAKSQSEIDPGASPSDLISVKVESPSTNQDVAALHARLMESEKTCQQLHQANEALDRALIAERDQKRMIEEELDLAKEHLSEEAKASDEYQILLGEINEPEFFAETNFSVSRNIRPYVYRLRRWFRGRRNYLCRTVKSRNYPQLVYIFYIFFIHIWLLTCVFS